MKDPSAHGLGAVISHIFPNGSEHPINFASRIVGATMLKLRRKHWLWSLGCSISTSTFMVMSTHVTDHKPLMTILGSKKGNPFLAAARLQRWVILLSGYCYKIEFRSIHQHCNADALSRLPPNVMDSKN